MASFSPASLAAGLRGFRGRRDPASASVVMCLAVCVAGLILFLLTADKPWSGDAAKRLAAGKELKTEHFRELGMWWGALAAAVAGAAALATQRWWSMPRAALFPETLSENEPSSRTARRIVLFFTCAAMLVAAWPRSARMDHSLWNDEEFHLRTYVWGAYETRADGSLKFDPVTWEEALFYNKKGNNHIWSSIECRLGHLLTGGNWGPDSTFRERNLRLFPFLSGVISCGLLVLLGAAMGSARGGLAAGLILALHPWHVRWSVEIRGYSTMVAAMLGGLLCLLHALRVNRWRWWIGYAACQAVFLLCFAGSVYVAAAQNLAALAVIWRAGSPAADRWSAAARLAVAGVWSFLPLALIMGPSVPQIAGYLKESHTYSPMNGAWYQDLWAHLVTGLRKAADAPGSSLGLSVNELASASPWRGWMVWIAVPALSAAGLFFLWKQDWRTRLVAGSLALGGTLAFFHNTLAKSAMMGWYVIYLSALFALALAWAGLGLSKFQPRALRSLPLWLALLFAVITSPALAKMMSVPRQPIRETIARMRGHVPVFGDEDAKVLTASFGDGARQMLSYDPLLHILKTPADLTALTQKAESENLPLYFAFRGRRVMEKEEPEMLRAFDEDPRWQSLDDVQGMEAMFSYEVYEFAPVAAGIRITPPPPVAAPARPLSPPPP